MMNPLAVLGFSAALLLAQSFDAAAQNRKRVPQFSDYPVKTIHEGKSAKPVFETDDQRQSVTYYQAIADGGTSFAGSYAVVTLTCGAKCIMTDFLDTRTGKITSGSFSNSGWKETHDAFREIEFRRASRLIVYAGQIDEKGPNGWHFYVFDRGKLRRLHTIDTDGDFSKPLEHWMK